jgi:hypothetical protein
MRRRASVTPRASPIIAGTFVKAMSSARADDDARDMRDVAMVIVVRNGRVNRSSQIATYRCGSATSAVPHLPRRAHVYTPFIAIFKLPFKFDGP